MQGHYSFSPASSRSGKHVPRIADVSGEATASTLKNREDVPESDTWNLSLIFPDDTAWETEFAKLSSRYAAVSDYRGTLGTSAANLARALEFETTLDRSIERLSQYAGLRLSEDSSNSVSLDVTADSHCSELRSARPVPG